MLKNRGPENTMNGCCERFQNKRNIETPGPGFYELALKESKPQHILSEPSKPRIKKEEGTCVVTQETPPPGTYDVNSFSIESRVKVYKNDENTHSPPFMSCVERFKSVKEVHKIE